jgi:hypothetical protein
LLEDCGHVRAQRRAPHLPTFAQATDVRNGAELHILTSKRCDLAIAQAGLDSEEQECPVPPSNPCPGVGSGHEGCGLFLGKKLDGMALVALGGDRKDALAV